MLMFMEFSPRHSPGRNRLYRNGMLAVILAGLISGASSWLAGQVPMPQYGHKAAPDKGPRALGLVQLSAKGKARIIPISVMLDGKFYDAGSYKASPVPMALDFGIVYEGFRAGVSQGVFTITQPGQLNHDWIAEGKWLPAGAVDPNQKKKYSPPVIAEEDKDDRPVLHRRVPKADSDSTVSNSKDADGDKNNGKNDDKSKDQQKPATAGSTAAPPASAPASAPAAAPPPETPKTVASRNDEQIEDPNRPRLRRGKPDPAEHHEPFTTFAPLTDAAPTSTLSPGKTASSAKDVGVPLPVVTFIPAISDAGGPEPRPYTYDLKPAEEAIYRNKMFELATAQLRAQAGAATKQTAGKTSASKSAVKASDKAAKSGSPSFEDVTLRIFDLSSSNEPVLVLSAKTHLASENADQGKEITLIARTNLEGEVRKLFFSQTDSRHLDVTPRMELIDAVDADGDGRGELLFRRTFDDGSAYAIYRVSADRLWPLFEGTP
jgi:hypothetical protein